jgi:hypothetical protein
MGSYELIWYDMGSYELIWYDMTRLCSPTNLLISLLSRSGSNINKFIHISSVLQQKLVFNPEAGQLEAKPSVVTRNESNESFFG